MVLVVEDGGWVGDLSGGVGGGVVVVDMYLGF